MTKMIGTLLFAVICCIVIAAGALQCFAPATLKKSQDRLRPQHVDWSASAGGAFFERLREKQARQPSAGYRLGGFFLMAMGIYMFVMVLVRLFR